MTFELLKKCRSYRRFDNAKKLSRDTLAYFVECARYTASAGNMQKLRFALVTENEACDKLFSALKFAAYLKEWAGPMPEERPVAYVVVCSDGELNTNRAIDLGIASEAIALAAAEIGVGSCMFRSFEPDTVSALVGRVDMTPHLVIALGYPSETVIVEDAQDGEIKYHRDELDRHVVPKLPLKDLIIR